MSRQSTARYFPASPLLLSLLLVLALAACTVAPEALRIATPTPATEPADEDLRRDEAQITQRAQPSQEDAPSDVTGESGPAADAGVDPELALALTFVPAEANWIEFNNWTRLKSIAGVPDLSSADPLEARMAFMIGLSQTDQARTNSFGSQYFETHAETWGWDSTDLLWEASFSGNHPPAFVLRFAEDFDLAPVLQRFDERGFAQSELSTIHGDVTLYSHPMDLSAEWLHTTEFAILNTAVLEEEKIFVLSSAPEAVSSIFEAQTEALTQAARPDVMSVAQALNNAAAVALAPTGCPVTDVIRMLESSTDEDALDTLREKLQAVETTGIYTVLGLGYRVETRHEAAIPVGVFVHHYPAAELAHADLETRRNLAETATSLTRDVPYAELFSVLDAIVIETQIETGIEGENGIYSGANLTLTVQAIDRSPQFFFEMLVQRDLVFAVCGGF